MLNRQTVSRVRRVLLTAMTVACGAMCSCGFGLKDLRHNVVAGTTGFVKGYTTSFWNALVPEWDDILNPGAE